MAKVERATNEDETEIGYEFSCPGCGLQHEIRTQTRTPGQPVWTFNGDLSRPTFHPSIDVRFNQDGAEAHCHSFVTDGRIQFLNDCTHALVGKTVELPDLEGV